MLTLDIDAHNDPVPHHPAEDREPHWRSDIADRLANDPPERWAERLLHHASDLEADAPEAATVMRICAAFIQGSPSHTAADLRGAAEMVRRQAIEDCNQVATAFTACGARLEAQGALTVARHLASIPLPASPGARGLPQPEIATDDDPQSQPPEHDPITDNDADSGVDAEPDTTQSAASDELLDEETVLDADEAESDELGAALPIHLEFHEADPVPAPQFAPDARPVSRFAQRMDDRPFRDPAVAWEEGALLAEIGRLQAVMGGLPLSNRAPAIDDLPTVPSLMTGAAIPFAVIDELDADPVFRELPVDVGTPAVAFEPAIVGRVSRPERVLIDLMEALHTLRIYGQK